MAGYSGSGYLDLVGYQSDGSRDTTFGSQGQVTLTTAAVGIWSVDLQPNGQILVGGAFGTTSSCELGVARFNPDGSLDSTFGASGVAERSTARQPTPIARWRRWPFSPMAASSRPGRRPTTAGRIQPCWRGLRRATWPRRPSAP